MTYKNMDNYTGYGDHEENWKEGCLWCGQKSGHKRTCDAHPKNEKLRDKMTTDKIRMAQSSYDSYRLGGGEEPLDSKRILDDFRKQYEKEKKLTIAKER